MWSAARSAKISMILCMPERVSGGDAKFQGFCDRWNKWEGQALGGLHHGRRPGSRADGGQNEKRLLRFQKQLAKYSLLVIDELGFVPLSKTGAELLFEVFSQRYERGATLVTSNLPFDEWTEIFGSERLTGALLDRLTHHVHILEMNGESYRLNQSQKRRKSPKPPA